LKIVYVERESRRKNTDYEDGTCNCYLSETLYPIL
jgi:hypothetical protein